MERFSALLLYRALALLIWYALRVIEYLGEAAGLRARPPAERLAQAAGAKGDHNEGRIIALALAVCGLAFVVGIVRTSTRHRVHAESIWHRPFRQSRPASFSGLLLLAADRRHSAGGG
jgi:hypothetical protein